jgi:probable HAF family extracellular repeat protein
MTSYVFDQLDDPSAVKGTTAHGINNEGQIVGSYVDANGNSNGFMYSDGAYTTVDYSAYSSTSLNSINDLGQIVGSNGYGLLYSDGSFTSFTFGGEESVAVAANGINDQGQIVGSVRQFAPFQLAYFASIIGLSGSQVELQNVTTLPPQGGPFNSANGINNEGQIVGNTLEVVVGYSTPPSAGFIYDNGVFTSLNYPGSVYTYPEAINDLDQIVGYYQNVTGPGIATANGFLYDQSTGTWTTIDVPGATNTYIYGINNADEIVGAYTDTSGNSHGFIGIALPTFPSTPNSNVDEWILSIGQWTASAGPGSHPTGSQVAGVGDFAGNGTDGILWYNSSTGEVDEWKISNGAWAGSVDLGGHPDNYRIAGIGDFNGDGTDDVLWTASSNGQVQTDIWELSNGQWMSSVSPGSHPGNAYVAGIGDFTGNGTSDILWYNSNSGDVDEWQIANGQWAASVDLGGHPGGGWQIAGIGHFFGNGIDDVLWTSVASNGQVQTDIWELGSNGQWINSVSPGSHPAGYQVAGIGDFNGNGTSDILWYNPATGDVDEWLIANGHWAASIDLGSHPGNYQIAGIGDFTGTGTSDILWHAGS